MSVERARAVLVDILSDKLKAAGYEPMTAPDDVDLLQQGVIDSLAYFDLVEAAEAALGVNVDMAALDADDATTIGGLARLLAES